MGAELDKVYTQKISSPVLEPATFKKVGRAARFFFPIKHHL